MVKLNEIIGFLLSKNIPVRLITPAMMPAGARKAAEEDFSDVSIWHGIEGFYKSGLLYICEAGDSIFTMSRYGEYADLAFCKKTLPEVIRDLCAENMYWWNTTCERNPRTTIPFDSNWLPLLVENGLVKPVVETRYVVAR